MIDKKTYISLFYLLIKRNKNIIDPTLIDITLDA